LLQNVNKQELVSQVFIGSFVFLFPVIAILFPRSLAYIAFLPGVFLFVCQSVNRIPLYQSHNIPLFVKVVLIWIGVCAFNIIFSSFPDESSARTLKVSLLIIAAAFGCIGYTNYSYSLKIRERLLLYAGLFLSISIIAIELTCDLPLARMVGYEGNNLKPHIYNRSLVAVVLLAFPILYFLLNHKFDGISKTALLIICFIALLFYTVSISWSQSAQLALICAVCAGLIFWLFRGKSERYFWLILKITIIAVILCAPIIGKLLFSYIIEHPEMLDNYILKKGAAAPRLEIWSALSDLIRQKPVLGHGIGTTRELVVPSDNVYWKQETILHPHNFAIQIWLELGLIGVVAISFLFWHIMSFIEKIPERLLRLIALLNFLAWLTISAVGYGMWQSWWVGLSLSLLLFYMLMNKAIQKNSV